jgi:hypothetical protein
MYTIYLVNAVVDRDRVEKSGLDNLVSVVLARSARSAVNFDSAVEVQSQRYL